MTNVRPATPDEVLAAKAAFTETPELKAFRDFAEHPEVVELTDQLSGGLIHPLEYVGKVVTLAAQLGIKFPS